MATWADRRDAYTAQRREQAREDQRRNALNQIFSSAYEPGETTTTPMYGPTQTGAALPPVVEQQPGQLNIQNALAGMYRGGFAPEAMQLEQQMRDSEYKRMQLGNRPSAVQVYEYYKSLPDDRAREEMLRTMRGAQYGDIGGVRSEMPVLPGGRARPLTTLENEVAGQSAIAAGREAGQVSGKSVAESEIALPGAESSAENVNRLIGELKSHEGKKWSLGAASTIPVALTPGTSRVDFKSRLEQLKGGAFLEARQLLKGGGQITDFEGKRAEAAMARLDTAQDEKAFDAALDDFNSAVQAGVKKLQAKSGREGVKIPPGARTGTVNGRRVFSTDGGNTVFDSVTGKRIK